MSTCKIGSAWAVISLDTELIPLRIGQRDPALPHRLHLVELRRAERYRVLDGGIHVARAFVFGCASRTAGVHVEMDTVLRRLRFGNALEEEAPAFPFWIDDRAEVVPLLLRDVLRN